MTCLEIHTEIKAHCACAGHDFAKLTAGDTGIPESLFNARCHPAVLQVSREVEEYFLLNWPFQNSSARQRFLDAGFSRVTCLYFPLSKNNRIGSACRLLTLLFLIDDVLEDMSFEDGAAYNARLMPLARGTTTPDRSCPVEYIMFDLWESMRQLDRTMANEILEPTFEFMRAQTDKVRGRKMGLGEYFRYRERDVGSGLLNALMRFCMCTNLSGKESELVREVEMNCAKHLAVVNDIWSFKKELVAANFGHEEGGALCSSVSIIAEEASLSIPAAKRVLYKMCREWEIRQDELALSLRARCDSTALDNYLKGLEYQMSGNEAWSRTTSRYR
ncbi:aristolochene synthase [Seiridium cupressi]